MAERDDDRPLEISGRDIETSSTPVHVGQVPRPAPMLLPRPRLTHFLDENAPLTLLRAPAGFGKSTLIAQWVAEQDPTAGIIAWLRVRPRAGDAATFWADAVRLLGEAGLRPPAGLAGNLDSDLARRAELKLYRATVPVVLVIDGFEHVTEPDLDRKLLDLVREVPRLRLVVSLRDHRHFPAHQYLDVETVVLTAQDLQFSLEETAQLMIAAGVPLPDPAVTALHQQAGGWPEPTRAVALRLRDAPELDSSPLPEVVGTIAAEYLRERLLSNSYPPGRATFATATALPAEFTAELAELLADETSAQTHLDALTEEGVLTAHARRGQVVYRWPTPARQALRSELRRRWPDRVPDLHRRLAGWYRDHDEAGLAVRHAVDSRDWELVLALIDSSWRHLLLDRNEELRRAFNAMPLKVVETSPRALAMRDTTLHEPDDKLLEVAVLPESPTKLEALGRSGEAADLIDTGFAVVLGLRVRGAFGMAATYGTRVLQIAQAAMATHPYDVTHLYAPLHLHVGLAQLLAGDLGAGMGSLQHAYERADTDPRGYVVSDAASKLAVTHAVTGNLIESSSWLDRYTPAEDLPDNSPQAVRPLITATVVAARMLVALDRLQDEVASDLNSHLVEHLHRDEFWAFLLYARAMLALHMGTASDALGMLDRARNRYSGKHGLGSLARPMLASVEADLLLALGRGNQARAVLAGPAAAHPWLRVGQARLALLSGDPAEAASLAGDANWEHVAPPRHRMEMHVIAAVAAHRLGDTTAASAALGRAIDQARATGATRPFITVPRQELTTLARAVPGAATLLTRSPITAHRDIFPSQVKLIELTRREKEVLSGLAEGLTVPQIAEASVLSYNTVRTQQRRLYQKLGTSDRIEAIARARRWALLTPES